MKIFTSLASVVAAIFLVSVSAAQLSPTWSVNVPSTGGGAVKVVTYPHAVNKTTQSATQMVYIYQVSALGKTTVTKYNTNGTLAWTSVANVIYPNNMFLPGDMDADSSGAYVMVRESGNQNFLHLQKHNGGLVWDLYGIPALGASGSANTPLFVKIDDAYVYLGVGTSSGGTAVTRISVIDKSSGTVLTSSDTLLGTSVTASCIQRRTESPVTPQPLYSTLCVGYKTSNAAIARIYYNNVTNTLSSITANVPTPTNAWFLTSTGSYFMETDGYRVYTTGSVFSRMYGYYFDNFAYVSNLDLNSLTGGVTQSLLPASTMSYDVWGASVATIKNATPNSWNRWYALTNRTGKLNNPYSMPIGNIIDWLPTDLPSPVGVAASNGTIGNIGSAAYRSVSGTQALNTLWTCAGPYWNASPYVGGTVEKYTALSALSGYASPLAGTKSTYNNTTDTFLTSDMGGSGEFYVGSGTKLYRFD